MKAARAPGLCALAMPQDPAPAASRGACHTITGYAEAEFVWKELLFQVRVAAIGGDASTCLWFPLCELGSAAPLWIQQQKITHLFFDIFAVSVLIRVRMACCPGAPIGFVGTRVPRR